MSTCLEIRGYLSNSELNFWSASMICSSLAESFGKNCGKTLLFERVIMEDVGYELSCT